MFLMFFNYSFIFCMCAGVLLCCSVFFFFLSFIFKLTVLIQVFVLAIESDHFLDVGFRN